MTLPARGEAANEVVLHFTNSRAAGGEDIAEILRENLGDEAAISAELDGDGRLAGYSLHVTFPTPEAAFDGALAIRNYMAAQGWPCVID